MNNKSKMGRAIIGLLIVAAGIYSVFFGDWKKEHPEADAPIRPLKVISVGESRSNPIRKYPGKVSALDRVTLGFQVDGPLVERPIIKGQAIKTGDLLARIDPRDYQNRLDSVAAACDQAAIQLERIKKAAASGAVSQADLTNAQAEFDRWSAQLRIVTKALEDTRLLAPFDAVIGDIFVDNFQSVRAKEPIVSIQKIEEVLVEVNVPEERILRARQEAAKPRFVAVFDSLPNREFDVKLHEFTTEADALTQTYKVTFSMPKPEDVNILSGMTATIVEYPVAETRQDGPILVPIDAVPVDVGGTYFTWKLDAAENGTYAVHRQAVEVGAMEGDSIQILKGLAKGDKIAASGVHILQEGQLVREFVPKSAESK